MPRPSPLSAEDSLHQLFAAAPPTYPDMSGHRFIIYGAGNFGRLLGQLVTEAGGRVECFLDRDPKGQFPWPVESIAGFDVSRYPDVTFLLGIFNAYVDTRRLLDQLRLKGIQHILSPVECFQWLEASRPPSQYWLADRSTYLAQQAGALAGLSLFADEHSRELYVRLWDYRLNGNLQSLDDPSSVEIQYFPPDLPAWETPLRLIDCGAFTGDTLRYIRKHGIEVDAIAAFEPDPANYRKLAEFVQSWQGLRQCALIPCGVFSDTTQLRFSAMGSAGSTIREDGNITIQCTSVDQSLPHFAPNLIKMDIEGAELDALLGAANTIRDHRPGLAISLYHSPDHLWRIPRLIADWDLGYEFHIRTHLYQEFETVLYAIPKAA